MQSCSKVRQCVCLMVYREGDLSTQATKTTNWVCGSDPIMAREGFAPVNEMVLKKF